jgi:hypothetical protein
MADGNATIVECTDLELLTMYYFVDIGGDTERGRTREIMRENERESE